MSFYLAYVNVFSFKTVIRKISITNTTASTLAAGLTEIVMRQYAAVGARCV